MSVTGLRRELPRFLRHLDRAARKADAEWAPPSRWPGLCVAPSVSRCEQIVYITKGNGLLGVPLDDDQLTGHATILLRYGCVMRELGKRVLAESRSIGVPTYFIGDLDPQDLTTYLTLACSDRDGFALVKYLGVDAGWQQLCHRYATERCRTMHAGLPTIEMGEFEREHLDGLLRLPFDWESLVGPEALKLLRSGYKLEIEGASNPAFYRRGFSKELRRHLFGRRSTQRAKPAPSA
jgi:hypothetical protein